MVINIEERFSQKCGPFFLTCLMSLVVINKEIIASHLNCALVVFVIKYSKTCLSGHYKED